MGLMLIVGTCGARNGGFPPMETHRDQGYTSISTASRPFNTTLRPAIA
jgi:hypothetical protein